MTNREMQKASQEGVYGYIHALRDYADEAGNAYSQMYSVTQGLFTGIEDSILSLTRASADWRESVANTCQAIADDIYRMLLRVAVMRPMADWLGGLMGGGKGGLSFLDLVPGRLFADGGVVDSPGLHAHVNTVVSTPTVFPFAKGAGLMGEAGPEAIMPLSRGADGRLGVKAEFGGGGASEAPSIVISPSITISMNGGGSEQDIAAARKQAEAIGQAVTQQIEGLVKKVLLDQSRAGGILNKGVRA